MISKLIRKLFLVKEIKSRAGALHFQRFRLLELPFFRIYIHHILKADEDGDEHDHPWDFASLVLKGGYIEQRDGRLYGRTPGGLGTCIRPEHHLLHTVSEPAWTLVAAWGFRTEWGYQTSNGWMDHITYRREKHWREHLN